MESVYLTNIFIDTANDITNFSSWLIYIIHFFHLFQLFY